MGSNYSKLTPTFPVGLFPLTTGLELLCVGERERGGGRGGIHSSDVDDNACSSCSLIVLCHVRMRSRLRQNK